MLGRLGFHLSGRLDERQQGQMNEAAVSPGKFLAQLPNGLKEGQAFDIANGSTDLHQYEISFGPFVVQGWSQDKGFDLIGDMRNDLNSGTQIVSAPFLLDDGLVDLTGRDVV
jgi:hypothetical protein